MDNFIVTNSIRLNHWTASTSAVHVHANWALKWTLWTEGRKNLQKTEMCLSMDECGDRPSGNNFPDLCLSRFILDLFVFLFGPLLWTSRYFKIHIIMYVLWLTSDWTICQLKLMRGRVAFFHLLQTQHPHHPHRWQINNLNGSACFSINFVLPAQVCQFYFLWPALSACLSLIR